MLKNINAVLFDLDGSLVDSMWIWKDIDREYLGRFNIPLPEDLQSSIEGMSFSETAVYFKEHFPIPDSIEQMYTICIPCIRQGKNRSLQIFIFTITRM